MSAQAKENTAPLWLPRIQVLVVDDLPANLLVARGLLAPYGLRTDTAASGREAVELVKNHAYDLIFMDQMMPEMDGVETAAAIRKLEMRNEELGKSVKRTPIIAMTANSLREMRENCQEKGFQDYLSKPIHPDALDVIINKYFGDQGCQHDLTADKNPRPQSLAPDPFSVFPTPYSPLPTPFSLELESQRLDMLNHYLVSFTSVPETEWQAKFDAAYFEKFSALIKSIITGAMPAALREQAGSLAEAGRKEDPRKIRDALPAFCGAFKKWREQEQKAAGGEPDKMPDEILPKLKKAILAGETETAEAAISELGAAALTPAGRELYFLLYALMLEGNTEKIMEAIEEAGHD